MKNFFSLPIQWRHEPNKKILGADFLELTTEPHTDLWQRTHYGFQHDNAPTLLTPFGDLQALESMTHFSFKQLYDQCGLFLYLDADNWAKISIEFANDREFWLGSVVTNLGYSDWAFSTIPSDITKMGYRLSRRDNDFLIEYSYDGITFMPMRIFHLHQVHASSQLMVGLYGCSPSDSSFTCRFEQSVIKASEWERE